MRSGNLRPFLHPCNPPTNGLKEDWTAHDVSTFGSKPDDTIRRIRGTHNRRALVSPLWQVYVN